MMEGLNRIIKVMELEGKKFEIITNNLANISTAGFKNDLVEFSENLENIKDAKSRGTGESEILVNTDYSQGPINLTENSYDLYIDGEGFFVVETPHGTKYTRDGAFRTNAHGELITTGNNFLLDENDKHIIVDKAKFIVTSGGDVIVDNKKVAKVKLVTFEKLNNISKEGHNLFSSNHMQEIKSTAAIQQGAIESSNVNAMMETVKMISIMRKYESYQKIVGFMNESLQQANQQVGRMG